MKVNFDTSYNTHPIASFGSRKQIEDAARKRKEKQIKIASTKKVVSECTTVAVGLTILYFAMKSNFMRNSVKAEEDNIKEQLKKQIPNFKVNARLLKPFLQ